MFSLRSWKARKHRQCHHLIYWRHCLWLVLSMIMLWFSVFLAGGRRLGAEGCTIGHRVSYFQQTWITDRTNQKSTSFYTKYTDERSDHAPRSEFQVSTLQLLKVSGGTKLFDEITFYLHCSNIKAYTYYRVHTLRSRITVPLTYFFPKKFPIPPHLLIFNFPEKQLKNIYVTWFEMFLLECVYSIFFRTPWTTSIIWMLFSEYKHFIIWKTHCYNDQFTQKEEMSAFNELTTFGSNRERTPFIPSPNRLSNFPEFSNSHPAAAYQPYSY